MRDGRAVQAGGLVPIAYSLDGSRRCCGWRSPRRSARALFLACMKTVPAAWAKARGSSRSYKIKSKSSRLPPLLQGLREARLWLLLLILTSGALRSGGRSEEHTSELQSLMRISYAVFFLKKKKLITTVLICVHNS